MKRKILSLLTLCMIILFTCGLVACDLFATEEGHVHNFDKQVAESDYLVSPATCIQKAKYYFSCECGEKNSETFEYGDFADHTFTNYVYNDDAKCEQDGTETAVCDIEGCSKTHTKTKENTALDHDWSAWVAGENDTYTRVCSRDSTHIDIQTGDNHVHIFDRQVAENDFLVSPATCIKKAVYNFSCVCREKNDKTFEYGNFADHTFTNYVYNDDAKCGQDGTETAVCDIEGCSEKDTKTKENTAFTHDWSAWGLIENDTYIRTCANDKDNSHTETKSGTAYTVSFEFDGEPIYNDKTFYALPESTITGLPTIENEGIIFEGWAYNGQIIENGDICNFTENVTLTAKYLNIYKIKFSLTTKVYGKDVDRQLVDWGDLPHEDGQNIEEIVIEVVEGQSLKDVIEGFSKLPIVNTDDDNDNSANGYKYLGYWKWSSSKTSSTSIKVYPDTVFDRVTFANVKGGSVITIVPACQGYFSPFV